LRGADIVGNQARRIKAVKIDINVLPTKSDDIYVDFTRWPDTGAAG
jgi:hypothetical protein